MNIYSFLSCKQVHDDGQSSFITSRFTIRRLQQQDISELSNMLAESFHLQEDYMRWLIPIIRMGISEDLRNRLRTTPAHYICLVATTCSESFDDMEHLVGTIELTLRNTSPWSICQPRYTYLSNLAVKTECRRQGIAHHLLSACEQVVLDWGFPDIYLHVLESNYQARQLYAKAGYHLHTTESSWSDWILRQPQRLFLRKKIINHLPID